MLDSCFGAWPVVCVAVAAAILLLGGPVECAANGLPDSVAVHWRDGIQAYQQGRYQHATDRFQRVVAAGFESTALYYNLGNAFYRLGETGRAIQHFEKARRLEPGNARIGHNLEMARGRSDRLTGSRGAVEPWVRVLRGWPVALVFWSGVLLYACGVVGAAGLRWWERRADSPVEGARDEVRSGRTLAQPVAVAVGTVGLIVVLAAAAIAHVQSTDRRAVVLSDRVMLRESPAALGSSAQRPDAPPNSPATSADTGRTRSSAGSAIPSPADPGVDPNDQNEPDRSALVEGVIVRIEKARSDGWIRVRASDGTVGWLPETSLGRI